MEPSNAAFLFVLVIAVAAFSFSAQRLYRFLRIGKDEPRWNDVGKRIWNKVGPVNVPRLPRPQ